MSQIRELSPEQAQQIAVYQEKWEAIALSTKRLDRRRAIAAVTAAYELLGRSKPEIWFINGPQDISSYFEQQSAQHIAQRLGLPLMMSQPAVQLLEQLQPQIAPSLWQHLEQQLGNPPAQQLSFQIQTPLTLRVMEVVQQQQDLMAAVPEQMMAQAWNDQQTWLRSQLQQTPVGEWLVDLGDTLQQQWQPIGQQLEETIWQPFWQPLAEALELDDLGKAVRTFSFSAAGLLGLGVGFVNQLLQDASPALIDYCTAVLGCSYDARAWATLRSVVRSCGTVLAFDRTCFVMERPTFIAYDPQYRLHAEGEPALEFADGSALYAYQGVRLPERYGAIPPHHWRSEWLLAEPNAEWRRVLIQGIGYERLCYELGAVELDVWREYTLLHIPQTIDVEPIYLLKMTCPSTGAIHATRVPPTMRSAREAIRWVNGGVDPAEFSTES
jgi:hypothetical protein